MRHALSALLLLAACDPAPTLGAVLARTDVPRILDCAKLSGLERAECLGAEALTTGLDVACERAAAIAEKAAGAPAGDRRLGAELDQALADVAREVDAAGGSEARP